MRSRSILIAALAMTACGAVTAMAMGSFHAPTSPAELALDRILRLADSDDEQLANLLHRPGADHRVDYRRILTPALIAAIATEERELVRKDCGGKYRKGEVCGLDYSPITCAQDSATSYVYHTILELGDKVVVEYAWPDTPGTVATFTMVRSKQDWKIDGVTCATGRVRFN